LRAGGGAGARRGPMPRFPRSLGSNPAAERIENGFYGAGRGLVGCTLPGLDRRRLRRQGGTASGPGATDDPVATTDVSACSVVDRLDAQPRR
jgi:hypothetical protein